jgi:hypothetical protein
MADFWGSIGNWLGDMTGANQANAAAEQKNAGQANQKAAANSLGGAAGKSATQFASEAGNAGQALGNQMGTDAATLGTQSAAQAARTAGVNKGQAALLGSQQAGSLYTQGKNEGQMAGMGAYGQGAGNQVNAGSALGTLGSNQMGESGEQSKQGTAAGGSLLGAIGGLFSDEKLKTDVKQAPDVMAILSKIDPVKFRYKPEAGEGSGEHVGATAQDIEKTPMKENVVDTPAGKVVDTRKQEMSNLDLIVQLAAKVKELQDAQGAK